MTEIVGEKRKLDPSDYENKPHLVFFIIGSESADGKSKTLYTLVQERVNHEGEHFWGLPFFPNGGDAGNFTAQVGGKRHIIRRVRFVNGGQEHVAVLVLIPKVHLKKISHGHFTVINYEDFKKRHNAYSPWRSTDMAESAIKTIRALFLTYGQLMRGFVDFWQDMVKDDDDDASKEIPLFFDHAEIRGTHFDLP